MTEPTPDAPEEPTMSPGLAKLAAAAASRKGGTTRGRTAPRRKTTTRKAPTTSRADAAARRGKYADRISGAIRSGCAVWSTKDPVRAAILDSRADAIGAALDQVAAEDKRVDAFLTKVSGFFGKSSAWSNLAGEAAVVGAGMVLAGGVVPAGPAGAVMLFLGGEIVNQGVHTAATRQAEREFAGQGVEPAHAPDQFAARVGELVDQFTPRVEVAVPDDPRDLVDADPGPAPTSPGPQMYGDPDPTQQW